jgi:hypothetical protein
MQGAPIIPKGQVAMPPCMEVGEAQLGAMGEQFGKNGV